MPAGQGIGLAAAGRTPACQEGAGCDVLPIPCGRRPEHLRSGSGIESGSKDQEGQASDQGSSQKATAWQGIASLRRARMRTANGGLVLAIALENGMDGRKSRGIKSWSSGQNPAETSLRFTKMPSHRQSPDQYSSNPPEGRPVEEAHQAHLPSDAGDGVDHEGHPAGLFDTLLSVRRQ